MSLTTPLRSVPGKFTNTPGPTPARHAQPNGLLAASSQLLSPHTPATIMDSASSALMAAQRATRAINDALAYDDRFPDVESVITQGVSADYDEVSSQPAMAPFQRVRTYDIPDKVFEQCNMAQLGTNMGLFAAIHHCWIAIDNALYVWDYTAPNPELIGFEEQANNIQYVKLVRPRPGVFKANVTHLLVVVTVCDILLIGVAAEKSAAGVYSLQMYRTNLSVNVRGLDVAAVAGSDKTGRIFFAGQASNDVYELLYRDDEGWFSSRCGKVNHSSDGLWSLVLPNPFAARGLSDHVCGMEVDDSRGLLYTLSSRGTIRAFHMATPTTLNLAVTRSLPTLRQQMTHNVRDINAVLPQGQTLASISPISANEATRLALMATTTTGCRIYLSVTSSYYPSSKQTDAPTSMQVHHVRLPFPDTPRPSPASTPPAPAARALAPRAANMFTRLAARYPPGFYFSLTRDRNHAGASEVLKIAAPDPGRIAALNRPGTSTLSQAVRFVESTLTLPLDGEVQDIGLVTPPFAASSSGPVGFGNELATQFDGDAGAVKVAVLTSTGVVIVRRRRLVDVFAALVRNVGRSDDALEVVARDFVARYGRAETMAAALAVCCGQAVDLAGDGARLAAVTEPDVVEKARRVFVSFGGKASLVDGVGAVAESSVRPSPRHEGLALYVARVLRSVWTAPVLKVTTSPAGVAVAPGVALHRLRAVQADLITLKEFLNLNRAYVEGLAGPEALARVGSKQEELALQGEHGALSALLKLVNDVVEGVAFVLVLFDDNDAAAVLAQLSRFDERSGADIAALLFNHLFATERGKELAKALVKAIVNANIEKGSNVDTVADALRRKCGSFCSADDVVVFKAQETLARAMAATPPESDAARELLRCSLALFEKIAAALRMDVLRDAVACFVKAQFWAGAIELVLLVAEQSDAANRAKSWVADGRPADDARRPLWEKRKECYDVVHGVIAAVDAAESPSPDVLRRRREEAYLVVEHATDELFLTNLYDRYLAQGWPERLLDARGEVVVAYLQRKALESVEHADLLWRYYAHHARYLDAAGVQLRLAKSGFAIGLGRRIEYLSRAKANASMQGRGGGGGGGVGRQEVLREVCDLLDLANIQEDLLGRLMADARLREAGDEKVQKVRAELDGEIKGLDDLYNHYVDQASYHDLALLVYAAADHRHTPDIEATWSALVKQTHHAATTAASAPWERVADCVRAVARKLPPGCAVLAPVVLVPLLARYYVDCVAGKLTHAGADPGPCWVPELCLGLAPPMPVEALLLALEALFYANDAPWTRARARQAVGGWIVAVCERWVAEARGSGAGGGEGGEGVLELLEAVERSAVLDRAGVEACRVVRGVVEGLVGGR